MRVVSDPRKLRPMIVSSRPASALRRQIRYYYQIEAQLVGEVMLQPVPARSPQILEFTFGAPYCVHRLDRKIQERAATVVLVGAQTFRRVNLLLRGAIDTFTIAFQPGGVAALFAVPAELLTNSDFDAELLLGAGITELHGRLSVVTSFADRVRVADEFLCRRHLSTVSVSGIVKAAAAVLANDGCVRVPDLAHHAGLGLRQFERRFGSEIGIPPKLYSRIVRFEAALRQKAAAPAARWTDIAHMLGYHDQTHMVRDFNRLSGDSPGGIAGQLDMFVQPEVNATAATAYPVSRNVHPDTHC
jgi:AraC-like DNA-binding protein